MNRTEHLLTVAAEEATEVAQRCTKALRFGLDQIQQDADDKPEENPDRLTNRQRIQEEFAHLAAVLEMIDTQLVRPSARQVVMKIDKVNRYLRRSKDCGTLQD